MRIVVIGGVAAGMSAAGQAKRRRPDADAIMLERGPHVSYRDFGLRGEGWIRSAGPGFGRRGLDGVA
jgi:NADPH-dependent 2,4-dienoyl-CoA reductase/sulfur reductase-like enzyme